MRAACLIATQLFRPTENLTTDILFIADRHYLLKPAAH